ncbi:uncharacterized protein LOC135392698 [Ornithodoros turicata]|uniref:uncharacterized protein LOC135392698 n=1 Tax=Ornithodoros turicata TaxID=34597 RepID=UPI00313889A1
MDIKRTAISPEPVSLVAGSSPQEFSPSTLLQGIAKRRSRANCVFVVVVAVVLLGLASLVYSWLFHSTLTHSRQQSRAANFCCPLIVYDLYNVMNESKDPCTQFYPYTCYAWKQNRSTTVRKHLMEDVVHPILQMKAPILNGKEVASSPSARIIAYHYGSCIQQGHESLDIIINTSIHAVLELLRGNLSPASSQAVLLENALYLSAECYLYSFMDSYYIENPKRGTATMYIQVSDRGQDALRRNTLEIATPILNNHFGMRVLVDDVMNFMREIQRRPPDMPPVREKTDLDASTISSPQEVGRWNVTFNHLHELQPKIRQETWDTVFDSLQYWRNSTRIEVTNRPGTAHILGLFADDSKRREAISLLVLLPAASLDPGLWNHQEISGPESARTCERNINVIYPLWDDALSRALTTAESDATVRKIYSDAVSAVKNEAFRRYESSQHSTIVSVLRKKSLLLPSERNPTDLNPSFVPIKGSHDDVSRSYLHCKNNLALFRYWALYDRYQELNFFTPDFAQGRDVYDTSILIADEYIYVPPTAYALLHLEAATDRLVNMAILGIQFVDALWTAIINNVDEADTSLTLWKCRGLNGAEALNSFSLPWLTLGTTALASMEPTWTTMMEGWGAMKVSPSRVFYMLVFYHHVCNSEIDTERSRQLSRFVSSVPDFNAAFNCTKRNDTWRERCEGLKHEAIHET